MLKKHLFRPKRRRIFSGVKGWSPLDAFAAAVPATYDDERETIGIPRGTQYGDTTYTIR